MTTSEHTFLAAYDAHADAIFRYCYARLGDRELAKDAVQETFHRAWRWLCKGNTADDMRALLYRTATNITIDEYRRGRTESLEALALEPVDESGKDPHQSAEISQAIALARALEAKYRDPLLMRYIEDMAVKDIAGALGETENTISVRIHRAIRQIKERMNPEHD